MTYVADAMNSGYACDQHCCVVGSDTELRRLRSVGYMRPMFQLLPLDKSCSAKWPEPFMVDDLALSD